MLSTVLSHNHNHNCSEDKVIKSLEYADVDVFGDFSNTIRVVDKIIFTVRT